MNNFTRLPEFKKILSQVPANYYDSGVKNNLLQRLWHTRKWVNLEKFLYGLDGRLLDIGCADGTTTKQIKKRFPHMEIYGIDLYSDAIKFAQKDSANITFKRADAHKLPFGNNYFDAITTIEVLEHMHNSEQVLKELHRVLKPGGTLVIVQDTDSLLFRSIWWLWTKSKGSVWKNSHINCMTPKRLIGIVKQNGFSVKKQKYMNFKMEIFINAVKKSGRKK